jgi:F-type H+-transporting ATPase subunit delta
MTTHTDALALVYARSLYELAEQAGGRDKIMELGDELEQICELTRGDRAFAEFLSSPIINRARRGDVLSSVLQNRVTDLVLRFLLVLNRKGRLNHLEMINTAYDRLVQEAHGRVEVDVYTATPAGPDGLSGISDRIKEVLGREPVLHTYTDPSMIGGVKLRIGDQLIDGSVATRLRRLKQSLLTNGSASMRDRFDRIMADGEANAG